MWRCSDPKTNFDKKDQDIMDETKVTYLSKQLEKYYKDQKEKPLLISKNSKKINDSKIKEDKINHKIWERISDKYFKIDVEDPNLIDVHKLQSPENKKKE